eukprot:PhM_4_TR2253/c0_g1_i2/m.78353
MIPRRVACDPKHQRDPRPNVHSVFYPGVGSSRQQGAKYAGPSGVTVTTRDGKESWRVCSRYSPRILHNVVPLPEVRDADVGLSLNPIRAVNQAATWAVGKFFRMEGNRPHYVYPTELNVGGRLDQDACIADVATAVKYVDALDNVGDAKQHIVMFGCSRGATTTLHAALRLPPDLARRVSLVLVEAPFDTLEGVMAMSSWMPSVNLGVLQRVGHYTPEAYELPETTSLQCPIGVISSRADTRVPQSQTMGLVGRLKDRFPHLTVEMLELDTGHHSAMSYGTPDDVERYMAFVDGLYDKYCT